MFHFEYQLPRPNLCLPMLLSFIVAMSVENRGNELTRRMTANLISDV